MATSGSSNYLVTRDKISTMALNLLNVIGPDETITGQDMNFANDILNMMIKDWQADGLHLWAKERGVLFLTAGTAKYTLGNASSDARVTKDSDAVVTTLSAAEASGQTVISVTSSTGMAASDNVGIVLDDDTIHWTTISTVDSAVQITIAVATTGAAASGNNVYTYTSKIYKPLRILDCYRLRSPGTSQHEQSLTVLNQQEYSIIANKKQEGPPSQVYYQPNLTNGDLFVWPVPTTVDEYITFTYERTLEDLDSSTDDPDFPQEWQLCLVYNLAELLGPAYGLASTSNYRKISDKAIELRAGKLSWDNEHHHIQFNIDLE